MKKILAIAIASAFAAPAFAATSNVDVYGVLNVGVNFVNDKGDTDDGKNTNVTSNASRLGFKGSEDLGGGLSAIWQIESGFNADETSSGATFGSRNTFVGLKGGFGTVLAGKHDTPMKGLGRKVDNFGDTMADSRNILGASDHASDGANIFDLRTSNTVAYVSPSFSGLTVTGAWVADHSGNSNSVDNNNRSAYSLSGVYENGPLMVGGGYEKQNSGQASDVDRAMWRIVGGYKFGDLKLAAQFERTNSDDHQEDRKLSYGLFANYQIGAITLKANYLKAGNEGIWTGAPSGWNKGDDAKQYTLGADYSLSKRTTAYAYYAKLTNDSSGNYNLANGGPSDRTTVSSGDDPSVLGIGMKHTF